MAKLLYPIQERFLEACKRGDVTMRSFTQTETNLPLLDTHIHLDSYAFSDQQTILADIRKSEVQSIISVSMNLASSKRNLELAREYGPSVRPAFGYHPEQPVPSPEETEELLDWMAKHVDDMVAVGEVGLPYYARLEAETEGRPWDNRPYECLLEQFIAFAKRHHKPVILHAVYEDAEPHVICLTNMASPVPISIGSRALVTPCGGWRIKAAISPSRPTFFMRMKFAILPACIPSILS